MSQSWTWRQNTVDKGIGLSQNECMPAKVKRTRIKVEEVEDEKPTPKESVVKAPLIKESEAVPKVTSFSQLDSNTVSSEKLDDTKPASLETDSKTLKIEEEPVSVKNSDNDSGDSSNVEDKDLSSTDVKEWLKDIRPDTTKDVEKGGNGFNGRLFFGLLLVFILLGALAGGLFYYKQKVVVPGEVPEPKSEEPTSAPTTTPTPEVKVDLTTYSVNILNGSGTPGEAGVVKNLLVAVGFATDKLKTANAGSYDFKSTEIQVKADVPTAVTDAVIKSLSDKYTVEVQKENLASTSPYQIVVTVGSKK